MATLKDVLASGYTAVDTVSAAVTNQAPIDLQPGLSSFMRCPLPPIAGVSPDSLRQFYRNGQLPQRRLFSGSGTTGGSGSGGGGGTVISATSSSSSSTVAIPNNAKLLGASSGKVIEAKLNDAHIYVGNSAGLPADVSVSVDLNLKDTGEAVVQGLQTKPLASSVGSPVDGQVLGYVFANDDWEPVDISLTGSIPILGSKPIEVVGTNPIIVSLDYSSGLTLDGSDHLELNLGTGLEFDTTLPTHKVQIDFSFADNEILSGSGTNWTLLHSPSPTASLMLFQRLPGFGGVLLIQGIDYTLSGVTITTINSLSAGVLYAFYRY